MNTSNWMSWEGGFDLVALSAPNLPMPNVIVHVARMVHTPIGSAPAGMILIPNAAGQPALMGFVSTDDKVARYFGPKIFAGTPFENAPTLKGSIDVTTNGAAASAVIVIGADRIEAAMEGLAAPKLIDRAPMAPAIPFAQRVVESNSSRATLKHNGRAIPLTIPPVGISGGHAVVWSATGLYAR